MNAMAILIKAVEAGGENTPPPAVQDELPANDITRSLEDIYRNLTGGDTVASHGTKFVISFPEVTLGLDEIWPNGDAPDHPSPEDVIEVMRATKIGRAHPTTVAHEWKLIDTLYVRYHGDENSDMEEWNGD
jgi:hypothetical protein